MPVASVACFAAFAACSSAFSWMHASSSSRTSLSGMGGGAASKMQKPATTHRLLPLGATFTLWPVPVPVTVMMSISGALDVVGNIARDSSVDLKKTWTPPPLVRVRELCTQISIKATTALFPGR